MLIALLLALAVLLVALPWGEAALAGLGRLAGAPQPAEPSSLDTPAGDPPAVPVLALAGLATLAGVAAVLSLFIPLRAGALAVAVAGALALAVGRRAPLAAALRRERSALRTAGGLALAALAVGGLIALARAGSTVEVYDTGSYHAQVIRWLEEHGTVAGVGMLHSRLASSAGWFTPTALFSLAWLGGRSFHVLDAAAYLLLLLVAAEAFADWRGGRRTTGALLRLALAPAGLFLFGGWLSSPSPDPPVAFLTWISGALFLDASERREDPGAAGPAHPAGPAGPTGPVDPAGPPGWRALALAVLAGFAVGIKLSAIPLVLLPLWLAVRQLTAGRRRAALVLALAPALAVAPFVLQTIRLSGFLVFPLAGLDLFDVDWKMPRRLVTMEYNWIRTWARVPHRRDLDVLALPMREWLPLWWDHQELSAKATIAAILVLAPLRALAALARRIFRQARPDLDRLALVAAAAAGVAFWFSGAPDPRFGWGFLLLLLLLLALPPLLPLLRRPGAGVLAAALLVFFLFYAKEVEDWQPGSFAEAARHAVLPADYPVPATRPVTLGGFVVQVPERRDQCWYEPFPCTPFPDPRIELRGAGLADGFRFDAAAPGRMDAPTWHARPGGGR